MILTNLCDTNIFLHHRYRTRRTDLLNFFFVCRDTLPGLISYIHSLLMIMTRMIGRT